MSNDEESVHSRSSSSHRRRERRRRSRNSTDGGILKKLRRLEKKVRRHERYRSRRHSPSDRSDVSVVWRSRSRSPRHRHSGSRRQSCSRSRHYDASDVSIRSSRGNLAVDSPLPRANLLPSQPGSENLDRSPRGATGFNHNQVILNDSPVIQNLANEQEIISVIDPEVGVIPSIVDADKLDDSTLNILGEDPKKSNTLGVDIHGALVDRWSNTLKHGLPADLKKELLEKYPPAGNLPAARAPKINPEIKTTMSEGAIKKDGYQSEAQEQLAASISAIGKALSNILRSNPQGSSDIISCLSDGARILADIHHSISITRRSYITPNLNRIVKNISDDLPVDEFLYGQEFADKLRAAKAMEKNSKDVAKPSSSQNNNDKPKPKFQAKTFPHQSGNHAQPSLNWKGPPRKSYTYKNNYRQGGQKPRQFRQGQGQQMRT